MPNFTAQIRRDYRDMTGLVLDLRSDDLASDEGSHDGDNNASVLTDSSKSWVTDALVGTVIHNLTDGSHGQITANTATTVTATLAAGTDNDWDLDDDYTIQGDANGILTWKNAAPAARVNTAKYSGVHDGGDNESDLGDSTAPWTGTNLVGMAVYNLTDGSMGWITANTDTTVTAALSGGTDDDWDDDDAYLIADPRFGDAVSAPVDNQPTVRTISGNRLLEFTRALSTYMTIQLERAFPPTWWTLAIELWKGTSSANTQVVFEMDAAGVVVWRRDSSGVVALLHGAGDSAGVADHPDGSAALRSIPSADVDYYQAGSVLVDGTPTAAAAVSVDAADDAVWLGAASSGGGSDFFEGRIRSLRLFARPMSPLEVDFLFQTMAADGSDDSVQDRATVSIRTWTDDTDDTGDRYPRITRRQAAPRRFYVAVCFGTARLQIAAAVAGKVRPDSELESKLFSIEWIDTPGVIPMVTTETGWSSVFDVTIKSSNEGHYSCRISREDGGGVILHFDVEGGL